MIEKVSTTELPRSIHEAVNKPKWKNVVLEEMKALKKNKTWDVVDLPSRKSPIGCKWVFMIKYKSDRTIKRHKARLVAKDFTQTFEVDYTETFAPVLKLNSVRILISIAVNLDWPLHQMDVKNALLNGTLEEEVYMDLPPGFEGSYGTKKF